MAHSPISIGTFRDKRFKRYSSYSFAVKDTLAPLVLKELARACTGMPIGFAKAKDTFMPVAVLGLAAGTNLFVAPNGRWVGHYVPAVYRGYPFSLANGPEGKLILCFDEQSGLLSDNEGEPFFGEDEKLTDAVNQVLGFLTQLASNRQATQRVCAALEKHGLIEPWPIKLKGKEDDAVTTVEGVFRISEERLSQLDEKSLYALHQSGALPVIYCQLLSMQHLSILSGLAKARQAAEQQAALPKNDAGDIDLSFLADDTTISFENL